MSISDIISVRGVLERNDLLSALTESQLAELAQQTRLVRFLHGEPIWSCHMSEGFFGVVAHGFVKMVRPAQGSVEATLEIMGPNESFGMLGTIKGDGCPLMAYALTDCIVAKVPKSPFMEQYMMNHSIKDRLVRKTALRMHEKLAFLTTISTGNVEEKLAAVLVNLIGEYGEAHGSLIHLDIQLTRQEIAAMAGTTTESTIRTLSKWSQAGIIETEHHRITVLRPDLLETKLRP